MTTQAKLITIAPLLFGLLACGPEAEGEENLQLFERRHGTCDLRCELLLGPECGAVETTFESNQECLDHCMSEDAANWALQDDDTDACESEMSGLYRCVGESTCEDQRTLLNTPALASQTPCESATNALLECNNTNSE